MIKNRKSKEVIAEMSELLKLPVGIDNFEKIRKENYCYIDKSGLIKELLEHNPAQVMLITRPRRFGKTLAMSMLASFFDIRKDNSGLFEGLEISNEKEICKNWMNQYPTLFLSFKRVDGLNFSSAYEMLCSVIEELCVEHEYLLKNAKIADYDKESLKRILQKKATETEIKNSLQLLTRMMQTYYGKPVILLIDEYDAPLLDVMHEEQNLPVLRNVMRNFYSPLKACDPYLRFVFLTGITKFSQLSIFSELNNIKNISMDEPYAAICGITEEEMLGQMDGYISRLASKLGITHDEAVQKLKDKYDGYHFTWPSPDIYNPYSLLNAFVDMKLNSYWFGSGTPTYLIEMLRKYDVIPQTIGQRKALVSAFDAPTERLTDITPLLYQSGYLTIKDKNSLVGLYTLDIPNAEIRIGLMESLLPNYLASHTEEGKAIVAQMYLCILQNDMDGALAMMQEFLLTVPYCDNTNYEGHYQQLFYVIFSLFGMYVDVEVRTPRGRVDMVMRTATTLYVIELKLNSSADNAVRQIDLNDYPSRFALCGLPIVKVGINFNGEKRTIDDWKIG